ncbi:RNA polymerase sigma factor, sigma-70 family [Clostridium frigidicarnis]|uniref:RNA polymerase sigma factor, sigma-70 family n=1 Tax=Clostridium frigidicarnis TaxID=84698 RepID=A0A1I0ZKY8_9CLOT|nr:RNA polymerase sigma factor, sigma-70 family [Clostridium frigidicarnis]
MNNIKLKILNFKCNDEDYLINKAIYGDKQSFSELIKKHKGYLYRTAYSYVKNEDYALEILQECTYRALLNIGKLKNSNYFKTWITRIIINCSIDFINKDSKVVQFNDEVVTNYEEAYLEEKLDLYNAMIC